MPLAAPAAPFRTGFVPARLAAGSGLLALALLLGGCQEGGVAGGLRSAGVAGKPDEFMVLPTRPLEMPSDLASLPPPTPGQPNRVDSRPHAEAIAGLTGRPGVPGNADGSALVAAAGPRDPAVRGELAAEDAEWRRTHRGRLLERMIIRDPDVVVYGPMVLDAPITFDVMRGAGVAVPAASPAMTGEE